MEPLDFTIPPNAKPYNPTRAFTIPANGSIEIELQGRNAQAFGFDRIIPYSTDDDNVLISMSINNDATILKPVQLSVLKELFRQRRLKSSFIIQKSNKLVVTLEDTSGVQVTGNISIAGYDHIALRAFQDAHEQADRQPPQPMFLFAQDSILANAANQVVVIANRSVPVEFRRFAVKTDNDPDITVSLLVNNVPIRNAVNVEQINYEFARLDSHVPYLINNNVDFTLQATNAAGAKRELSFLAEGYIKQ